MHKNNVRLPQIYLTKGEFLPYSLKRQLQIKINRNAVIGDMRPVGIRPNFTGLLINMFSISQVKLKNFFRIIKKQNTVTKDITDVPINFPNRYFLKFLFRKNTIVRIKKISAEEGAIGM